MQYGTHGKCVDGRKGVEGYSLHVIQGGNMLTLGLRCFLIGLPFLLRLLPKPSDGQICA